MKTEYKILLSEKGQDLVDRLEAFSGLEIEVQPNPHPLNPSDPNPDHLALAANNVGAAILYRSKSHLVPHGIVHELLHLERYWIEKIPQIVPIDRTNEDQWGITSAIENCLEHLVIVPREAAYGFEPFAYWTNTEKAIWGRYPWPTITNPWARRKNCLLGWLTVSRLNRDPNLTVAAEAALRKEGLRTEALHFAKEIDRVLEVKDRAIATVVRFLNIPRKEAALLVIDVKNRKCASTPI